LKSKLHFWGFNYPWSSLTKLIILKAETNKGINLGVHLPSLPGPESTSQLLQPPGASSFPDFMLDHQKNKEPLVQRFEDVYSYSGVTEW